MPAYIVNDDELYHGREWSKHKYIRKEGDRYIYPEDVQGAKSSFGAAAKSAGRGLVKTAKAVIKNTKQGGAKEYYNRQIRLGNEAKAQSEYAANQRKKYGNTNAVREAEAKAKALRETQNNLAKKRKVTAGDNDFKKAQKQAKRGANYVARMVSSATKKTKKDNKLVRTHDGQLMTAKRAAEYDNNYKKAQAKKINQAKFNKRNRNRVIKKIYDTGSIPKYDIINGKFVAGTKETAATKKKKKKTSDAGLRPRRTTR